MGRWWRSSCPAVTCCTAAGTSRGKPMRCRGFSFSPNTFVVMGAQGTDQAPRRFFQPRRGGGTGRCFTWSVRAGPLQVRWEKGRWVPTAARMTGVRLMTVRSSCAAPGEGCSVVNGWRTDVERSGVTGVAPSRRRLFSPREKTRRPIRQSGAILLVTAAAGGAAATAAHWRHRTHIHGLGCPAGDAGKHRNGPLGRLFAIGAVGSGGAH